MSAPESIGRNLLAGESSPYLRQHADNPVHWQPWGEAAFARARAEDKPIFLSIGYSTCHWCHVMAHESFENAAIAAVLNEHFVSIKVDREERPDVDRVHMAFVQATTGHGGWPMSVWLTPGLKPFYGGTYFPPEDRWGRPGFATILLALARVWREERERVFQQADHAIDVLRDMAEKTALPDRGDEEGNAEPDVAIERAFLTLSDSFDAEWGGFGRAPKFPQPSQMVFLGRVAAVAREAGDRERAGRATGMAAFTLRQMIGGGIHDQIGGGFHRYSVDGTWHVPHFEKMLYDQSQIVGALVEAFQATGETSFSRAAAGAIEYVRRDLTTPGGAFFAAEDADSDHPDGGHGEGAFYVWSAEELRAFLGEKRAAVFAAHHGVQEAGNAPEGADPQGEFAGLNILTARRSVAETARTLGLGEGEVAALLADGRAALFAARSQRPRPHRDEKILAAWNGLMISACARAGAVLGDETWVDMAARAARFFRDKMWSAERGILLRSLCYGRPGPEGFAEDYAFLTQGLLDLYEATFDIAWLQWADEMQATLDRLFWDETGGGYFSSSGSDPSVLVRMKEEHDGAEPAPSSIAAMNLLRLGRMLGDRSRVERAGRVVEAFRGIWSRAPHAMPFLLAVASDAARAPRQVVLAGTPGASDFEALARAVRRRFEPGRVVLAADGGVGQAWLAERAPWLREMGPVDGRAAAYVCEDFACRLPVTDPAAL